MADGVVGFRDVIDRTINDNPPMSAEEEQALIRDHADDPDYVREQLVLHNLRFAIMISSRYNEKSETFDDMVQRAFLGLVTAAADFDFNSGRRFTTYAYWHIKKSYRDLYSPNLTAVRTQQRTYSVIDQPIGDGDDPDAATVGEFIAGSGQLTANSKSTPTDPTYEIIDPAKNAMQEAEEREGKEVIGLISRLVESLDGMKMDEKGRKLDREILRMRVDGKTLEEIGEVLGITRERVRQRQDNLFARIRTAIVNAGDSSEFEGFKVYVRTERKQEPVDEKVTNEEIHQFIRENRIKITQRSKKAKEVREKSLMRQFEDALEYYCKTHGANEEDALYKMMRQIYFQNVVERKTIDKTAKLIGIPVTYAKWHRRHIFQMIKDMRKVQKRSDRELYGSDNGPQYHFKPWYGGFYSEWSRYHRGEAEIEMTRRELSINIMLGNIFSAGHGYRHT